MLHWIRDSADDKFLRDEGELIAAIKSNSERAFEFLYREYYPTVEKFIVAKGGVEEDAKDIFQESVIAVWNNIKKEKYESKGHFKTYLIQICKFRWYDHLKGGNRKYMIYNGESYDEIAESEEAHAAQQSEADEIEQMLHWYDQLEDHCKNLLTLFYFENKSFKEIGKILKMEPSSAKNARYRCVNKLKNLIKNKRDEHSKIQ